MKREIVTTEDGLKTIHLPEMNENYHSTHGAFNEAIHVFIQSGFREVSASSFSILEIGFGTGLNAILSLIQAGKDHKQVKYTSIEAYPVLQDEVIELAYFDYPAMVEFKEVYLAMHSASWEQMVKITPYFELHKIQTKLADFIPAKESFDLIYFDAFGPDNQPEMWTKEIFQNLYDGMKPGGIFVTYSAKGQVRRDLTAVGFEVERIPGPPGKREMLRARK